MRRVYKQEFFTVWTDYSFKLPLKSLAKPLRVKRFVSAHCFSLVSREWCTRNIRASFRDLSAFWISFSTLSIRRGLLFLIFNKTGLKLSIKELYKLCCNIFFYFLILKHWENICLRWFLFYLICVWNKKWCWTFCFMRTFQVSFAFSSFYDAFQWIALFHQAKWRKCGYFWYAGSFYMSKSATPYLVYFGKGDMLWLAWPSVGMTFNVISLYPVLWYFELRACVCTKICVHPSRGREKKTIPRRGKSTSQNICRHVSSSRLWPCAVIVPKSVWPQIIWR